jgi:hypothetical protein
MFLTFLRQEAGSANEEITEPWSIGADSIDHLPACTLIDRIREISITNESAAPHRIAAYSGQSGNLKTNSHQNSHQTFSPLGFREAK